MEQSLNKNIIIGLERISEAFKSLLREKAQEHGISPIQIQILLFIAGHKRALSNVSYLAKEFNVTKPTVSDAVKVLHKKGFVEKHASSQDSRSYTLSLSKKGHTLVNQLDSYSSPLNEALSSINSQKLSSLYSTITHLIAELNQQGVLTIQRNCQSCSFYEHQGDQHFCTYLKKQLKSDDFRIDCPEHELATEG